VQIGMVGLGRMGAGLTRRLQKAGHEVVVYDVNRKAVEALAADGAVGATSLADLAAHLDAPRAVWLMIPAAFTEQTVHDVAAVLAADDAIIDGGNSDWRDDIRRATALKEQKIHYIDAGTSGGVFGLERGFCLMVGGDTAAVDRLAPVFDTLASGFDSAPRTPGRTGEPSREERGWMHCGASGAGHFVKMVHNGIEYGIMAAYAEGLAVLQRANEGKNVVDSDAETAPLSHPELYEYALDIPAVTEVWRRGSVIASWLLDLTAAAFVESPDLSDFNGRVSDSGEGRWTAEAAIALGVPTPVLTTALQARFASQGAASFAGKVQSAQRKQFGGHAEKPASGE
jgi:6-phosphogluconate dehydrogenase